MIILCPHCGHKLDTPLNNGMSSCLNCERVFDSSKKNLILSTAWLIKKRNITDPYHLSERFGLLHEDAELLIFLISEKNYCQEEFLEILKEQDLFDLK